jgi:hypothetical protein
VADEPVKRFLVEIDLMIRARYPAIYVVTWEEGRLESLLYELGCQQGKPLQIWTASRGLYEYEGQVARLPEERRHRDPLDVLTHVHHWDGSGLFLLKDFHVHLENPAVVRLLKDVACDLKNTHKTLILAAPSMLAEVMMAAIATWVVFTIIQARHR